MRDWVKELSRRPVVPGAGAAVRTCQNCRSQRIKGTGWRRLGGAVRQDDRVQCSHGVRKGSGWVEKENIWGAVGKANGPRVPTNESTEVVFGALLDSFIRFGRVAQRWRNPSSSSQSGEPMPSDWLIFFWRLVAWTFFWCPLAGPSN